jgi:3-isopropylmalate dehydrogenase
MMLRYSLGHPEAAERIEHAVQHVLQGGYRTADLYTAGMKVVSTQEMGRAVAESL